MRENKQIMAGNFFVLYFHFTYEIMLETTSQRTCFKYRDDDGVITNFINLVGMLGALPLT